MIPSLIRWLFAFVLLAATFNPTQLSYYHWARSAWSSQTPFVVLGGLLLAIGYIIYLRATIRSIGAVGMALVAALFAALVWVLVDVGLLQLDDPRTSAWLLIVGGSLVLGVGLSWSIIRRRLSGQADVDDVDL